MYLFLDVFDSAVYRGFRHAKAQRDFNSGVVLNPKIEYLHLLRGKITGHSEPFALQFGKLLSDIHLRTFPVLETFLTFSSRSARLTSIPLDFPSRLRCATILAIQNVTSDIPLDKIGVSVPLSAVHHVAVKL